MPYLQHTIGGDTVPLLKVSNIASSSISDDSDNFYISVQLTGHIVVWFHSFSWTALSHWAVPDELKHHPYISCMCVLCVEFCSWI